MILCYKQHDKIDAWVKNLEKSFNDVVKKGKVTVYEINIVKEMINDIVKIFNKEDFFWKNQQVIGVREVFRGIVVKSWVGMPVESIDFKKYNKILMKKAVEFSVKVGERNAMCCILLSVENNF